MPTMSIVRPSEPVPDVLVFGEALVDVFDRESVLGGAPFNVARHLAGFGLAPWLISRVGKDGNADLIRDEMARWGMSAAALQTDGLRATGMVTVHIDGPDRHRFEIASDAAWDHIDEAALPLALPAVVSTSWLYYGTLGLRARPSRRAWQRLYGVHCGKRYLDLNWRAGHVDQTVAWQAFALADVVKLNSEELAMLLDWNRLSSRWATAPAPCGQVCPGIAQLLAPNKLGKLIVTYGSDGYAAYDRFGHCESAGPALQGTAVIDTVGAGDAFSAVVLAGLVWGWNSGLALRRASEFAAAICGVRGAVPQDSDFYKRWCERWQLAHSI